MNGLTWLQSENTGYDAAAVAAFMVFLCPSHVPNFLMNQHPCLQRCASPHYAHCCLLSRNRAVTFNFTGAHRPTTGRPTVENMIATLESTPKAVFVWPLLETTFLDGWPSEPIRPDRRRRKAVLRLNLSVDAEPWRLISSAYKDVWKQFLRLAFHRPPHHGIYISCVPNAN